ncbi:MULTISPECIES: ferredoxin [Marichromatium]|uniref:(2Fe-2S) ferredoxin n=1 Tax=Marichromatium gracile TaxID=1048 RepID=A0A4R4AD01_MARGR|nr:MULTISPECIES: (2Fe-2S) ferredoxin domain-containing protein [Marichromatium]MBO8084562.1 (2Fe-2S) ferredoxin domain-containing protein [Marichromatium sp.]MBK1709936.1 2Fe-2S ferredoxin [Marichromatium gracile]RNE91597.1 (2Fe-2S) ferredoxin domain-containing protein [Marichromatium sp. AB31]RNE93958.1 (2Fe-2S) ferredoxin domain-containing protein [Marichromatium sp. AB32]TCW36927.1 (2Fe-2S) ferredoxin [Marichromatium gracile]
MTYYRHHVFFCTNARSDGRQSCDQCGALEMRNHLKQRAKALGLTGPGGVQISTAGCLGRCELGPVIVVYPEGVWYTFVDQEDIEEILQSHLLAGKHVDRLKLPG